MRREYTFFLYSKKDDRSEMLNNSDRSETVYGMASRKVHCLINIAVLYKTLKSNKNRNNNGNSNIISVVIRH